MIHTKTKDIITRTAALLLAFGLQGGTVHQLSELTGVSPEDIIYCEVENYSADYMAGSFAYSTNTREFNKSRLLDKYRGNKQFWIGVATAVNTHIKMKIPVYPKF